MTVSESNGSLSDEARELLAAAPARPPRAALSVAENREGLRGQIPLFGLRPALHSVRDDVLGAGNRDVRVRIYRPAAGELPVVVYAHGGGWALGDLETHDALCAHLAVGAGAVVIAVDYRQPPEHPFPAAVLDVLAVVSSIRDLASDLQVDAAHVAVAGDSAGGNLVAVAAQQVAAGTLVHQVLILPTLDTDLDAWLSYRLFADGGGMTRADMEWYFEQYTAGSGADLRDPRLAPYRFADLTGLPPATILTAECDPLRDEGEAYAGRLREAGVPVTLRRFAGMFHPFYLYRDALSAAREAQDLISDQLRAALHP
jgi:acetyl esterase